MNPFSTTGGADALGELDNSEGRQLGRLSHDIEGALKALVHDPDFPCVGAKSVVNQESYHFGLYPELGDERSAAALAHDLYEFIQARPSMAGEFTSYIAAFVEPKVRDERQFEKLLWRQLALLHELDRRFFTWSKDVSADPDDPSFSFSFAENAFFVVGLSPASGRWARRFSWPALVFNDHAAFQRLREEHRFDRMRDLIRHRDIQVHGSANPMLADYGGSHSEARQYAGREVPDTWRCPVHFEPKESHDRDRPQPH